MHSLVGPQAILPRLSRDEWILKLALHGACIGQNGDVVRAYFVIFFLWAAYGPVGCWPCRFFANMLPAFRGAM